MTNSKATATSKATKGSKSKPEVTAPAAPAANPFAALVVSATAPAVGAVAPTGHAAMVAKALAAGNAVSVLGATVKAADNVAARATTLGNLPATVAATSYVLAKAPRVRVPYTAAALAGMVDKVGGVGTVALGSAWAAASTGDFTSYAVKSGWLVKA